MNKEMKPQKDWTEALRDQLKDAQVSPPADGWERLAEPQPIPPLTGKETSHPSFWRSMGETTVWLAAAAAVLAAVLIINPFGNSKEDAEMSPLPMLTEASPESSPEGKDLSDHYSLITNHSITLHLLGAELEGNPDDNLVVRAYQLLKSQFPDLPAVEVWLYKHIPSGAGLGGGSADATFMLRLLNTMFALGLDDDRLEALSGTLGADCPFFVRNVPVRATGTGNIFSPVTVDLSGYRIVVVKPPVFISTREAFSKIDEKLSQQVNESTSQQADEQSSDHCSLFTDHCPNDFEQSVFPLHPELPAIKEALYRAGAVYASMSGSGSALYGLFPSDTPCPLTAADFPGCFFWTSLL